VVLKERKVVVVSTEEITEAISTKIEGIATTMRGNSTLAAILGGRTEVRTIGEDSGGGRIGRKATEAGSMVAIAVGSMEEVRGMATRRERRESLRETTEEANQSPRCLPSALLKISTIEGP
jgi:hypothetical protein